MSIFRKNSGKGYSVGKKFQIGPVNLMTQMTSQKKTELIDDSDLVWTIKPQLYKNFWKMEAVSPKTALKIRILETSIRHKNSKNGPTFVENSRKGQCIDHKVAYPHAKIL